MKKIRITKSQIITTSILIIIILLGCIYIFTMNYKQNAEIKAEEKEKNKFFERADITNPNYKPFDKIKVEVISNVKKELEIKYTNLSEYTVYIGKDYTLTYYNNDKNDASNETIYSAQQEKQELKKGDSIILKIDKYLEDVSSKSRRAKNILLKTFIYKNMDTPDILGYVDNDIKN